MAKNKIDKWFEGKIQDILKEITAKTPAKFYRYPDMRSTGGGFANKQPGDFFLLANGKHIDIEVKTSEKYSYFREGFKALIKDHQVTASIKTHRAGGQYIFIFYSSKTKMIELWDGKDIREPFVTPRMKLTADPIFTLKPDAHYTEFLQQFTK